MTPNEIRFLASALEAGLPAVVHATTTPDSFETEIVRDVLAIARITGTPRPRLLRVIADGIDDNVAITREATLAAVAARHSAVVLAALPAVTAVLASLFGINSLGFLIGSPLGVICLVVGIGLTVVGWRWMARLRRSVRAPSLATGLVIDSVAEVVAAAALSAEARDAFTEVVSRWGSSDEWEAIEDLRGQSRQTGVPVAGLLRNAARDCRRRALFDVREVIENLPGRMVIPLGVCLFPAFVTLTVVPAVAGMTTQFLRG